MSKKLKVFGVNYDGKTRRIVAATSQKMAAELIGTKLSHFRNYGSETSNKEEIELAVSNPGIVFSQGYGCDYTWEKVLK